MTGYLWAALGILAGLGMTALGDMVSEEIRDRLDHLPHAILRLAACRLDPSQWVTIYEDEWLPELSYILRGDEARPVTRLIRGTAFALGILFSAVRIARLLHRPLSPHAHGAAGSNSGDYGRRSAVSAAPWVRAYLQEAALVDLGSCVLAVYAAAQVCFGNYVTVTYLGLSLALPLCWIVTLWLIGGYDIRFIGTGWYEFRNVLKAGAGLTAAIVIGFYAVNMELSRGYLVIALPGVTLLDMLVRYTMRRRLHRWRRRLSMHATGR